jgi:hypothetical protein
MKAFAFHSSFIVPASSFLAPASSSLLHRFLKLFSRESERETQAHGRAPVLSCGDQQISHTHFWRLFK